MSNVAGFFWSYLFRDRKQVQKEKEKVVVCVHVFRKKSGKEISRFAYKSHSSFVHEREARAVDFLCFLRQKRAREREVL